MKFEDIHHLVQWELYQRQSGGQQCAYTPPGVIMKVPDLDFLVGVDRHKSMLKNKEECIRLLNVYLEGYDEEI